MRWMTDTGRWGKQHREQRNTLYSYLTASYEAPSLNDPRNPWLACLLSHSNRVAAGREAVAGAAESEARGSTMLEESIRTVTRSAWYAVPGKQTGGTRGRAADISRGQIETVSGCFCAAPGRGRKA